ncbi:Unknown protein, partial [Striga hermonthica]
DLEMLEGLERELTPWEKTYLDELHERRNIEEYERQLMEAREAMVIEAHDHEDEGALNFLILEDKESLEEEGKDTEVVINPGESDNDDGDGLDIWLENMLEKPSSPTYRPSCVRDWPKRCGPRAKLKPKRCNTKRARRKPKAKTKEEKCWCKPCARKRRACKMEARRRGKKRMEDGWLRRAGDCTNMEVKCIEGWDPWEGPWSSGEHSKEIGEQRGSIGDVEASTSGERASFLDAREIGTVDGGKQITDDCANVGGTRRVTAGHGECASGANAYNGLGLVGLGLAGADARGKVGRDEACYGRASMGDAGGSRGLVGIGIPGA